jgi:macrolide transport system ATP-binding/permease protein
MRFEIQDLREQVKPVNVHFDDEGRWGLAEKFVRDSPVQFRTERPTSAHSAVCSEELREGKLPGMKKISMTERAWRMHEINLNHFLFVRFTMHAFWQDVRYAARTLRNSAGFTIIAIVTLGLGMAVNTAVFSVINGVILRPLAVPHAEQLTVLSREQKGAAGRQRFSYPEFLDLRNQANSFSDIFGYGVTLSGLAVDGKGDHCVLSRVTGNYFSALGVQPYVGRLILPSEGQAPNSDPVLILGYSYWQKRFAGDRNVVGKHAEINGHGVTIIGVVPKSFHGTYAMVQMDGYVPLSAAIGDEGDSDSAQGITETWTRRDRQDLALLGRLKPGVDLKQARASLAVLAKRFSEQYPDVEKDVTLSTYPEKLARPEPDPDNTIVAVSLAFSILAGLVLLVACFNITNVLLVRATVRQRETAIRAALGAGRRRLLMQYLTESLLLALLGGAAGWLLAVWAAGFLSSLPLGTDLPIVFDFEPDWRVGLFALGVVLLTGLVVGLIPALRMARSDVNSLLREGGRGMSDGRRRHVVRNALVVAQLAGSLLLLVVAGLFVRSLGKIQQMNLGFNPDHVMNFSVDVQQAAFKEDRGKEFYKQIDEQIRALPGVISTAQAFTAPMGYISSYNAVFVDGRTQQPGEQAPNIGNNTVSPSYFDTLQIALRRGRVFTEADGEKAPRVAVINETMAKKLWPQADALGKRFRTQNPARLPIEVIGVVADGKYTSATEDPQPFFYLPLLQVYQPLRTIHVRTAGPPEGLALQIESRIHAIAPSLPVSKQTMTQSLQGINGFFFFRLAAQLTATMGLLGLILAVVGVYSVVSYAAAQRTHEIGIRMALGAAPGDILSMVLRENVAMVAIGLALGLVLAFAGTRAIANLIVGIRASDPATFVAMLALLSLITLAACWIPARRATRVSPLTALRYE